MTATSNSSSPTGTRTWRPPAAVSYRSTVSSSSLQLPKVTKGSPTESGDDRAVVIALGGALVICIITQLYFFVGPSTQIFAQFSLEKKIVLPPIFVLAAALTLRWRGVKPYTPSYPLWWGVLLVMVSVSTISEILDASRPVALSNQAQACALFGGQLLLAVLGLRARNWSRTRQQQMIALLLGGALIGCVLGGGLAVFAALIAPAPFVAAFLSKQAQGRGRVLWLSFALLLGALEYYGHVGRSRPGEPFSQSTATEFAASALLLFCLIVGRRARRTILAFAAPSAVVLAWHQEFFRLATGDSSFADITLAQRGYETRMVFAVLDGSHRAVSWVIGAGPAATVDLRGSPDQATLASSGRNLAAVDDVHLLTSYLLLKFGLLGVVWLTLLLLSVGRTLWRVMSADRPSAFDAALLFFPIAAIVAALPAATDLFSDPMTGLLTGVLFARRNLPEVVAGADASGRSVLSLGLVPPP